MNVSLSNLAESTTSALSASNLAATFTAVSVPSAANQAVSLSPHADLTHEVLRGNETENASALQWFGQSDPATEAGIIIVGGKTGRNSDPATEHGIIIVGGDVARNENPVAERGIIIVGGKTGRHADPAAERGIIIVGGRTNNDLVDSIKSNFDDAMKDLESQDKMDNFAIQTQMSNYNQSETLASSVLKKEDDTTAAIIDKI